MTELNPYGFLEIQNQQLIKALSEIAISTPKTINLNIDETNSLLLGENFKLKSELEEVRKQNADTLEVLEAVEWIDVNTHTDGTGYDSRYVCPWCGNSSKKGHAENCARQAAIKKAKGEK